MIFRCKPSRPPGARERNKEICKLIMGLTYDEGTRSMFINNLKAKMNEYNLEVVYLASPPNVRKRSLVNLSQKGTLETYLSF